MTRFILDSGDPKEYSTIAHLAKEQGSELWGGTTNPTLIAKSASQRLAGKKLTQREAFELQKEIIYEIVEITPGAVSAEVYADLHTSAEEMIEQGREIASWHERVVVKLPTNLEGFKARTELRKDGIMTNNTLVFSQQQIYAICLHEHLVQKEFGSEKGKWPPFISPFVGRLDDIGENGMSLVEHGMSLKNKFTEELWMLEASVRSLSHFQKGLEANIELITAPAAIYTAYFTHTAPTEQASPSLTQPNLWEVPPEVASIDTLDTFFTALETNMLDIRHELTEKGIIRFTQDWQALLHETL